MIISLIFFSCSGIFLALLWYGKRLELQGRRQIIYLGSSKLDHKLASKWSVFREYCSSIDSVYVKEKLHDIAEKGERVGLKVAEKGVMRFAKMRDKVVGKNLPKNRGSVSFILKHIESHKKAIDKGRM